MTILYRNIPIHECTERIIINPMVKLFGYNVGHPLDDFILHNHPLVYKDFFEVQPEFGTVRYIESEPFLFASAIVGEKQCLHNEKEIVKTLLEIRDFGVESNDIDDIAIDIHSFISIPGGEDIINLLKKVFPRDTITVYTGTKHLLWLCQ